MVERLLYLLACLGIPFVWGSAVYLIARRLEARRGEPPPRITDIDYYI